MMVKARGTCCILEAALASFSSLLKLLREGRVLGEAGLQEESGDEEVKAETSARYLEE